VIAPCTIATCTYILRFTRVRGCTTQHRSTPMRPSTHPCVPLTGRGCRQPVCAALGGTVAPTACTGWGVAAELEGADAAVGW
jgi:hypothetical protein